VLPEDFKAKKIAKIKFGKKSICLQSKCTFRGWFYEPVRASLSKDKKPILVAGDY